MKKTTIVEMLRKKNTPKENGNVVEGVKQLALIDVDGNETKGTGVDGHLPKKVEEMIYVAFHFQFKYFYGKNNKFLQSNGERVNIN